ncbi:SDR family oxidoreductase [Litorimonas sp.]|uniref:SDR family oxidoreductase n=1 Tax=Litorimonas sp. TaxID=1892381 RepID=UPI003A87CE67
MDLGIKGKHAIVMASSKGLGFACANALAREGVNIVLNGRRSEPVQNAAKSLRQNHGISVVTVVADCTSEAGRSELLNACPEPDILILNGGGPPPTAFAKTDQKDWENTLHNTLISPLLMVQSVLPGMRDRQFGRIVAITSAMVKTPHPVMSLSHAPRTGLTSVLKSISRDCVADNVTINQLLPERFDTDRHRSLLKATSKAKGVSEAVAEKDIINSLAAGRLGRPEEFGDACAFLCAAQSGYICGQNLMLDGGNYRGQPG